MKYTARKVGNSIGVTIPKYITELLEIKNGEEVNIKMQGKKIIITKEEN